ncbi:MAG: DUF3575 domain-containing protein [Firmicutes bacterium]|nr:DUF3575 domain-containing protein [Bacillota bacterium]MCM1401388.1 DUF3575 domain-containing protein [Bacteroides sp.]MCM1477342.1 DUF3575 domain-containing protein [Bacteroides sp.]
MHHKLLKLLLLIVALSMGSPCVAQRVALKSNVIDWLLISPNLSMEARISPRITLDFGVAVNPFDKIPYGSDIKLRNFRINPEVRYWFNRPMAKHFVGFALSGGSYNLELKEHCYNGDFFAAGFTYGYALVLSKYWNVEFTAGIGLAKLHGFDYRKDEEKPYEPNNHKWIPVPIRAGVTFSYMLH